MVSIKQWANSLGSFDAHILRYAVLRQTENSWIGISHIYLKEE